MNNHTPDPRRRTPSNESVIAQVTCNLIQPDTRCIENRFLSDHRVSDYTFNREYSSRNCQSQDAAGETGTTLGWASDFSVKRPEACSFTKRCWKKQDGEQLLKPLMVELLMLGAECSLVGLKTDRSSRLLPGPSRGFRRLPLWRPACYRVVRGSDHGSGHGRCRSTRVA